MNSGIKQKQNAAASRARADFDAPEFSAPADAILLGVIGKPKGVRGLVWVYSYASDPADIASYGALTDIRGTRSFAIEAVEVKGAQVAVRIDGIADRNAAESLRGIKLYVSRSSMPQLGEGRYYHADLIGMRAIDKNGNIVGTVADIYNFGAGDVIDIERDGADILSLPFHDRFVGRVDVAGKKITVDVPDVIEAEDEQQEGQGGDA